MDSKEEIGQSGGGERMAEELNFLEIGRKQSSFKDIRVPPASAYVTMFSIRRRQLFEPLLGLGFFPFLSFSS